MNFQHLKIKAQSYYEKNRKQIILAFLFTFIWGLWAHGFAFFNITLSHDALYDFYSGPDSDAWQISLGRVLVPLYHKITGSQVVLPWSSGLISLVWIAASCYLVIELLGLTKTWQIIVISGIMTCNRTMIALIATFAPWLGSDMMALLLAVISVCCWKKYCYSRNVIHLACGSVSLACSMALYQSFLSAAILLIILCSIASLLDSRNAAEVFRNGLFAIAMVLFGAVIYFILMKTVLAVTGVTIQTGSHNTLDQLWTYNESIIMRVVNCLKITIECFFSKVYVIYPKRIIVFCNILLFAIGFLILCMQIKNAKPALATILLLALLLLAAPFAANIIRLVNSVHDLMLYAVWLLYLLPILLLDRGAKYLKADSLPVIACVFFLFVLCSFAQVQTANLIYVEKEMQYDAALSIMTTVMHDIETQDGYIEGETPVLMLGKPEYFLVDLPERYRFRDILLIQQRSPITYTLQEYFRTVLQRNVLVIDENSPLVPAVLPVTTPYPSKDYIAMVDGVIVIDFNDT